MTDKFVDLNGEIRLQGTLVAPGGLLPAGGTTGQVLTKASNANGDADWETGGGGGYTPPITREQLNGNNVSIANGAGGVLTWDGAFGPDVLLDLTDPTLPTIIASGVYSVTVEVLGNTLTVGGEFNANLQLDVSGEDASFTTTAPASITGNTSPRAALTLCYYLVAGAALKIVVTNLDGAATRNFSLVNAFVQRVS